MGYIFEALHRAAEVGVDMAGVDYDAERETEPTEEDVAATFASVAPECLVLPPEMVKAAVWLCLTARREALEDYVIAERAGGDEDGCFCGSRQ